MIDYKIILGGAAVILAYVGYVPYFRDILKGTTKPHAFSWLIWGVLTSIGFAAQFVENGGAGAWVTGADAFACFLFFAYALKKGDRHFVFLDWISLFGAFVALLLWWFTDSPTLSVILITVTDIFGYLPTFRKGFYRPYEETAFTYALSSVKFWIALMALQTFSLATWLYPLYLAISNGIFTCMLLIRRHQLRDRNGSSKIA